jgi:hypothetical protein
LVKNENSRKKKKKMKRSLSTPQKRCREPSAHPRKDEGNPQHTSGKM